MNTDLWPEAHRQLGDTPCPHGNDLAVYCGTCTENTAALLAHERDLTARENALATTAEELDEKAADLDSWSYDLERVEAALKQREEQAERKASFLKRAFRKR